MPPPPDPDADPAMSHVPDPVSRADRRHARRPALVRAAAIASLLAGVGGAGGVTAQATRWQAEPTWPVAEGLPAEARQFDFWVGEWAVNLRTRQSDFSFADTHAAVARIYPILRGKAVLELWDSRQIKGYSLRYFDVARQEWVLWLNWPGPGRSGSSSLSGEFRHGRGDFYSRREGADGTTTLSRYSFNDITPTSLRWDDAYSQDGGDTWNGNWIMEFSRTAAQPTLHPAGGPEHTYAGGGRCEGPGFAALEPLVGRYEGTLQQGGEAATSVVQRGYHVLGGCAVLLLWDWDGADGPRQRFAHVTHNTYANRPEITILDDTPASPAVVIYGDEGATSLGWSQVRGAAEAPEDVAARTVRVEIEAGDALHWTEEAGDDGVVAWAARLRRAAPID